MNAPFGELYPDVRDAAGLCIKELLTVNVTRTGVTTNSATATNCVSLYDLRGIY